MTTFNAYAVRMSNLSTLEEIEFLATSFDSALDRISYYRECWDYGERDNVNITIQTRQVEGVK